MKCAGLQGECGAGSWPLILGNPTAAKPLTLHQLLITREQWQEMSMTGNSPVERLINEQKDDFSGGTGL